MNSEKEMKNPHQTIDLVYIALGAVLISICSWISIPTTVPFTMQTFAVFFVLSALGGKRGTVAIIVYILLGAVGIPVFSNFTSGIGILLGNTGGYIVVLYLWGWSTGCLFIIQEKSVGRNPRYGYWLSRVLRFWKRVVCDCLCSSKWSCKPYDGSCLVRNTVCRS